MPQSIEESQVTSEISCAEWLPLYSQSRRQVLIAVALCAALFSINAYICRDLFFGEMPAMNSMHGFWASIAQRAGNGWFRANWWPWSDLGMPFEFTYAPLVPALTAAVASVRHSSTLLAFQSITAIVYCLTPVTLFLLAWGVSGAPVYSFLAALFYSLTAISRIFAPEGPFSWESLWDARRLSLVAIWDDTPHMLALTLLPITLLCLLLTIRTRRVYWAAATTTSIALATLASAFGPTTTVLGAACLLFVIPRRQWLRNLAITGGIGLYAWAICAPFFSPSLISAMHAAAPLQDSDRWNAGSWTALALVAVGWAVLWWILHRYDNPWHFKFFVLLTWLTGYIPVISHHLHRSFLPQPGRYGLEMEFAFALVLAFGIRLSIGKTPRYIQLCLLFLILAFAGEQVVSHRQFAKGVLRSAELQPTIESRAVTWTAQHLSGTRISLPGSIAMWAGNFAAIEQLTGGSWSMAYNLTEIAGAEALRRGAESPDNDARVSLDWLKAFGVGAVVVPGPKSPEFWKDFVRPPRFDGILPLLWREDDTSIYRVPQPNPSLAHIVPESALVRNKPRNPRDVREIERYVAALDREPAFSARFRWNGVNAGTIDVPASNGQAISVQVNWNAGWHARVNSLRIPINRDGLGLMWMKPGCSSSCRVDLFYTGDIELTLCRAISYIALAGLLVAFFAHTLRIVRRRAYSAT
jgi:hypothetical protein